MNDYQDKITEEKILNAFEWESGTLSIMDKDVLNFINHLVDDQYQDELDNIMNSPKCQNDNEDELSDILYLINSLDDGQGALESTVNYLKFINNHQDELDNLKDFSNRNQDELFDDQDELFIENYFLDDVIISSLNDAINEIVEYFNSDKRKTRIKNNPALVNELFYDDETFRDIAEEYLDKFNTLDERKIHDRIAHIDGIHMQMPKIIFPWSFYLKETWGKKCKKAKKGITHVIMDMRKNFKLRESPSIVAAIRGLFLCHNVPAQITLYK